MGVLAKKAISDVSLDSVMEMLSHQYFIKVLKQVVEKPQTITQIHQSGNVPLSSVYKAVEFFLERNIIKVTNHKRDFGRSIMKFSANLDSFVLIFNGDSLVFSGSNSKFKEKRKL